MKTQAMRCSEPGGGAVVAIVASRATGRTGPIHVSREDWQVLLSLFPDTQ